MLKAILIAALAAPVLIAGTASPRAETCKAVALSCSGIAADCRAKCAKTATASRCAASHCVNQLAGCKATGVWRSTWSKTCWATKKRD